MHYHIILTEKCNSQCRYCCEKSMQEFDNGLDKKFKFEFDVPCDMQVKIQKLKSFLKKDKNPTLIFYGGEPLLQAEKIKEIIDNIDARFCMQTNGKLLSKLPEKYLNKISRILVSIDGSQERTDYNRGEGTYNLVLNNLKEIRKKGCKGEIVARMCIAFPDIFKQVKHLITLIEDKIFDSVHFQLDMGFYKNDFNQIKFSEFIKEYNSNLSDLINFWIDYMRTRGRVLKIYPFLGIFESLHCNEPAKLRCGAGHSNYTITTDGKITACPIMNNIKDFYCGDLNSNPQDLKVIDIIEPCTSAAADVCTQIMQNSGRPRAGK